MGPSKKSFYHGFYHRISPRFHKVDSMYIQYIVLAGVKGESYTGL